MERKVIICNMEENLKEDIEHYYSFISYLVKIYLKEVEKDE